MSILLIICATTGFFFLWHALRAHKSLVKPLDSEAAKWSKLITFWVGAVVVWGFFAIAIFAPFLGIR